MKNILQILITSGIGACRVIAGLFVVHAGYKLTLREGVFTNWSTDSSYGGIFVMLLGLVFIALGLFPNFFKEK